VALTSRGRAALDAYTWALRDLLGGLKADGGSRAGGAPDRPPHLKVHASVQDGDDRQRQVTVKASPIAFEVPDEPRAKPGRERRRM
jgi:hypothetical protein